MRQMLLAGLLMTATKRREQRSDADSHDKMRDPHSTLFQDLVCVLPLVRQWVPPRSPCHAHIHMGMRTRAAQPVGVVVFLLALLSSHHVVDAASRKLQQANVYQSQITSDFAFGVSQFDRVGFTQTIASYFQVRRRILCPTRITTCLNLLSVCMALSVALCRSTSL